MSRMHKLVPLIGGLLLSKGGRRVAGRHAGKLALATLAYEVWRNRRDAARHRTDPVSPDDHPSRRRWSGRPRA